MTAAILLGMALTLDSEVGPLVAAERAGRVGRVEGRAFLEAARPGGTSVPLGDVFLALLPRSDRLLSELGQIRDGLRRLPTGRLDPLEQFLSTRAAAERRLEEAGAVGLGRRSASDPDGSFALEGVPAGRWLLLAWHTTHVPRRERARKGPPPAHERFEPVPPSTGQTRASMWVVEVDVLAGETYRLRLTDRSLWVSAVTERLAEDQRRR